MICPNCNKENDEEAVVCEFCGYGLNSEEKQIIKLLEEDEVLSKLNNKYASSRLAISCSLIAFVSTIVVANNTKSDSLVVTCCLILLLSIIVCVISSIKAAILSRKIKKELKSRGFSVQ